MDRARMLFPVALVLLGALVAPSAAAHEKLGTVSFPISCRAEVQAEFDRAVALLHSFAFQESTRAFAAVAQRDPDCAMAHWGVAMNALGNPFAWPPSPKGLADGRAAIARARAVAAGTARERDYVAALETFYRDAETADHRSRAVAYERAMAALAQRYPADREAAVFHALALNAIALPSDKTYAKQLEAAAILERVFAEQPDHPGVAHYLIHSYDYPSIAERGLPAARRYAGIAPSAPHALHMPSHIFTRRGFWEDSIASNRASAAAAANDFDRLHAMDYLVYAHLQRGEDADAVKVLEAMVALGMPNVEHFVTAYALAAIPARYALERGRWEDAARLTLPLASSFPWARFPQSEAILVFARGLGAARAGDAAAARRDLERLAGLRDALQTAKQAYWAEQVDIQHRIVAAWTARAEGRLDEGVTALRAAAEMEDATTKHPVTPGPIVPARELLGEMLLEAGRAGEALRELETSMRNEPNRFRGLAGAARAAGLAGDGARARDYYARLTALAGDGTERDDVREARRVLGGR